MAKRSTRSASVSAAPEAQTENAPSTAVEPALTKSPATTKCGRHSPVSKGSLTSALPASTVPSTGISSPARTWTISPGRTKPGAR